MELLEDVWVDGSLVMYSKCDDCQHFHLLEGLHALLWPMSKADQVLQDALHVEEAQGFCPDCLAQFETEADRLDPEWRVRQRL